MTGPARIQLRRTKGWRKPADAVVVARPSKWGNPFHIGDPHPVHGWPMSRGEAVELYRAWLAGDPPWHDGRRARILDNLDQLVGHDLACWCPLDQPCHADVLLELATGDDPDARVEVR